MKVFNVNDVTLTSKIVSEGNDYIFKELRPQVFIVVQSAF